VVFASGRGRGRSGGGCEALVEDDGGRVADPPPETPEPEAFRALEQRLEEFKAAKPYAKAEPGNGLLNRSVQTAKDLADDYLVFARSASPEWRVAGLCRSAQVMERLADGLEAARLASGSSEEMARLGIEEMVRYRELLAVRTTAARGQALDDFGSAAETAKALGVQSRWVRLARAALDQHFPRILVGGARCQTDVDCERPDLRCVRGVCATPHWFPAEEWVQ
jgi:hypothetical protein